MSGPDQVRAAPGVRLPRTRTQSETSAAPPVEARFSFGEVTVHAVVRRGPPPGLPAFARWPCPGCGRRQLIDDVWQLEITDRPTGTNLRHIMVCAGCGSRLSDSEA